MLDNYYDSEDPPGGDDHSHSIDTDGNSRGILVKNNMAPASGIWTFKFKFGFVHRDFHCITDAILMLFT